MGFPRLAWTRRSPDLGKPIDEASERRAPLNPSSLGLYWAIEMVWLLVFMELSINEPDDLFLVA